MTKPMGYWTKKENRVKAIRGFVEKLDKPIAEITQRDFTNGGLLGLLSSMKYYFGSPFLALKEAGYDIKEWEMKQTPRGFWDKRENRVKAIKWLVEKLDKPIAEITQRDFTNGGLSGLIQKYYSHSPLLALKGAGYDIKEWEMQYVPKTYWKKNENRINAVRRLVNVLDKPVTKLTVKDFERGGLGGLLNNKRYYSGSPFLALKSAGYDIKEWEMTITQRGFWNKRENRIEAIKWLVEKLDKPIAEIYQKDFINNGLSGVLQKYYSYSTILALKDAGYDIEEWERLRTLRGYWNKKENRIKVTRWLVEKLDKPVTEITQRDFHKNVIKGLLNYYSGSPYKALKDAGYDIKEWEMTITPRGYWDKKKNKIKAIKWLVEKLDKPITEITQRDFGKNGLGGLIQYYSDSPYFALIDAGYDVNREEMRHSIFKSGGKRHESNHGHKCYSGEEREVDNIFWSYKLTDHKHNVRYPGSKMNCDFVFGGKYWVEYAGLLGIDPKYTGKSYDEGIEEKKKIAKKNNIDLIILTRNDIISKRYLKKINHIINELGSFNQNLDDFIY